MKKVLVILAVVVYIAATNADHNDANHQPTRKHRAEQAWCAREWSRYEQRIKGYKVLHVDNPVGQAKLDLLAAAVFKGYDCPQTDG